MGINVVTECSYCYGLNIKLRKIVASNGVLYISWYCLTCNHWAENPVKWRQHYPLEQYLSQWNKTLDDIPAIESYIGSKPCLICGAPGEEHHWAPRAYREEFGENWMHWTTEYLCPFHHQQWHNIVTPALVTHNTKDQK